MYIVNNVFLRGAVVRPAVFSHDSHGVRYYQLEVATLRLSGAQDALRVLVPEEGLRQFDPCVGDTVEVEGQLRSFNNKSGVGSRLVVSVLARSMRPGSGENENSVSLTGSLCKAPVYRKTPLGREICDLLVAAGRPYGRADYLPVICWGQTARDCAELEVGSRIAIEGRFQSRVYIKQSDGASLERTAYEVSAVRVVPEGDSVTPESGEGAS